MKEYRKGIIKVRNTPLSKSGNLTTSLSEKTIMPPQNVRNDPGRTSAEQVIPRIRGSNVATITGINLLIEETMEISAMDNAPMNR